MSGTDDKALWQNWVRRPQSVWLRRVVLQIHLWSGITFGLYIFFISVTGSVLVYRNELYVAATPEPFLSRETGPLLSDEDVVAAALRAYPEYRLSDFYRPENPNEAVEVWLVRGSERITKRFDPRSGEDVGSADMTGIWLVATLIELHADLLSGATGRRVNGIGAFAVLLSALTGLIIWWPGIRRWRRSLVLKRGVGTKRFIWDLHSAMGLWSVAFTVVFAVSGLYLSFPLVFHGFVDWFYASELPRAGPRLLDDALAWLAYSHFGRINGIGLPCSGPGVCDQTIKAIWAIFGMAPAALFVTGVILWWNRVVKRWLRRSTRDVGA